VKKVTKTCAAAEDIAALKEAHPEVSKSIDWVIDVYEPPVDEVWVAPAVFPEVEVSNHGNVRDKADRVHKVPRQAYGKPHFSVVDNEGALRLKTPEKMVEEAFNE